MRSTFLISMKLCLFAIVSISLLTCGEENDNLTPFVFPPYDNIDSQVYHEIKNTCKAYWDLNNMIDSTFEIISEADEFSVNCDGMLEGDLYHFVIRVDSEGKWINDGRSLV